MQLYRYMARAILVPFVFEAPPMRVDTLDTILLPEAISIGYWLKNLPQNLLYETVENVQESVEGKMDGRLAMQYALYLLCAKEV